MGKTKKHTFVLVGIGNHKKPVLTPDVLQIIKKSTVFSGGKRHYELLKDTIPTTHKWIFISGSMDAVVQQYKESSEPIVVFTSGDPFFYGFGNTLQSLLPNAKLEVHPYFNSLQRLCHKTHTNYSFITSVSVHGRPWDALDIALIKREKQIGVLTDAAKNPSEIAKRMLQYGFDNYKIIVGEELDGAEEKITEISLQACVNKTFKSLNCVLLLQEYSKQRILGFPNENFHHLPNRENMITKMPIRLCTIQALNLTEQEVFWDIGACTGSVAIEAKNWEPTLDVVAFEKRTICKAIIQKNKEQFATPGIQVVIDDFFELDLKNYAIPDVVFIGGHGNRLEEMLEKLIALNKKIRIVTNAVKTTTSSVFTTVLEQKGFTIQTTRLQVDEHNKIKIHTAVKY